MRVFRRRKGEDDDIIEGEIEEIGDDEQEQESESDDSESVTHAEAVEKTKRRGFFRRQSKATAEAEPTVERVHPDIPTPDEAVITEYVRVDEQGRRRRLPRFQFRLPRVIAWNEVRPAMLLLAIGLVAGGVFWTLHNLGETSLESEQWYPAVILVMGVLWAIVSLAGRRAAAFLAATALVGISISLLLSAQELIDWRDTMVGTVLITVGVGIVARGFLLRQGTVAR